MTQPTPSLADIRAELDRARMDFHRLVLAASPDDLARKSNGTDWTNRQLLFHMLFGYLITRNLRVIVTAISRAPDSVQHGFAHVLDTTTPVFHKVNYWGSCAGAMLVRPARADAWLGRVVASLHRHGPEPCYRRAITVDISHVPGECEPRRSERMYRPRGRRSMTRHGARLPVVVSSDGVQACCPGRNHIHTGLEVRPGGYAASAPS